MNKKIKYYSVLTNEDEGSFKSLVIQINDLIYTGWQPLGGLQFENNKNFYYQTMVMYEDKDLLVDYLDLISNKVQQLLDIINDSKNPLPQEKSLPDSDKPIVNPKHIKWIVK